MGNEKGERLGFLLFCVCCIFLFKWGWSGDDCEMGERNEKALSVGTSFR
jgi:hypothetical protein